MLLLPSHFLEESSREGREVSGAGKFSFAEKGEAGTSEIGEEEGSHAG